MTFRPRSTVDSPVGSTLLQTFPTHEDLREFASVLYDVAETGSLEALRRATDQFFRTFQKHVREEEADHGAYSEMASRSPKHSLTLERLKREHSEILELLATAKDARNLTGFEARELVLSALALLRKHGRDEDRVMEDVYYRDQEGGEE